jgi:hypothetical protein
MIRIASKVASLYELPRKIAKLRLEILVSLLYEFAETLIIPRRYIFASQFDEARVD